MPFHEFKCPRGHVTEEFYKTISEGEKHNSISCPVCYLPALKIFSTPLPPHLYGDPAGYHKPSPTKRYNTKTVSQKEGNKSASG